MLSGGGIIDCFGSEKVVFPLPLFIFGLFLSFSL